MKSVKDVFNNIKEEIKSLQGIIADPEAARQTPKAADNWLKNNELNIAVTGSSGAGKSSFINAIRGIEFEDEGAAEVRVVETTNHPTPYKHPKNPNLIFWEIPSVHTLQNPQKEYLERVKFEQFDFFMIISKNRFTENDLWLTTQIQKYDKPLCFIRSHVDVDIHNDIRTRRKSHSPESFCRLIRRDCMRNLLAAGIEFPQVFLLDTYDRESYDFGHLEVQLYKYVEAAAPYWSDCIQNIFTKTTGKVGSLSSITPSEMGNQKEFLRDVIYSSEDVADTEESSKGNQEVKESIEIEIKALQDVMENQGIEGVKQTLRANAGKWMNIPLNIGVTGGSGVGKSSFINALRNIEAEDEGAAKVGVVETTTTLTPYKHPKNPNFVVWDMPGVGTPNFPQKHYIKCVKFEQYDFFIIITKDRFTENDLWLAKQIQDRHKSFYFVRANIDTDILSDSRSHRKSHSPEKLLSETKSDCINNLTKAGIESPLVFLVDNFDRETYDFGKIEAQLLKDTPSIKIDAMALSLSTLTKEVLIKKKEVLTRTIEDKAMEIACTWSISDQKEIYEKEIAHYKDQFNIKDNTLQDNKDVLMLSEEKFAECTTIFEMLSLKASTGLRKAISEDIFLLRLGRMILKFLGLGLGKYIPTLEFSCRSLKQHLEEMYEMALNVYDIKAQRGLVESIIPSEETEANT